MTRRSVARLIALSFVATFAVSTSAGVVVKGFGISPKGFPVDYSQLPDFFAEAARIPAGGVMWNGAWRDDVIGGTNAGIVPVAARVTLESSFTYGFTPSVVFGWRSGTTVLLAVPGNATNDWTNAQAKERFRGMLDDFARTYQPPFVFLGNENDFYYEQNPADYANWIAWYDAAYEVIKAASPATLVGPVFNYEHMAGSGALNGWTATHWSALEMHDFARVDIVGITLYPWLHFATAAAIPADYLAPLMSRIGAKPIAITETGWPAENLGGLNPPWETSEAAQVTYLARLSTMLDGKPVLMVNHLFLHAMTDPGGSPLEWKLSGSISIRDASGNPREVYDAWLSFLRTNTRRRVVRH
jgi:hypothetical protein